MLEIVEGPNDELKAKKVFQTLSGDKTLNFARLEYISSAGLGVLLATQQRLAAGGKRLRLINTNSHVRDIFHFSGFDQLFEIA